MSLMATEWCQNDFEDAPRSHFDRDFNVAGHDVQHQKQRSPRPMVGAALLSLKVHKSASLTKPPRQARSDRRTERKLRAKAKGWQIAKCYIYEAGNVIQAKSEMGRSGHAIA